MYSYKVVLRGGITKYYDGKVCEAINWLENTAYKSLWTTGTDLSSDGNWIGYLLVWSLITNL